MVRVRTLRRKTSAKNMRTDVYGTLDVVIKTDSFVISN